MKVLLFEDNGNAPFGGCGIEPARGSTLRFCLRKGNPLCLRDPQLMTNFPLRNNLFSRDKWNCNPSKYPKPFSIFPDFSQAIRRRKRLALRYLSRQTRDFRLLPFLGSEQRPGLYWAFCCESSIRSQRRNYKCNWDLYANSFDKMYGTN